MKDTFVNGLVLNERISKKLFILQDGYANAIANGLDVAIGYLLENRTYIEDNNKELLDILETLHDAKTELLALVPKKEKEVQHGN